MQQRHDVIVMFLVLIVTSAFNKTKRLIDAITSYNGYRRKNGLIILTD